MHTVLATELRKSFWGLNTKLSPTVPGSPRRLMLSLSVPWLCFMVTPSGKLC